MGLSAVLVLARWLVHTAMSYSMQPVRLFCGGSLVNRGCLMLLLSTVSFHTFSMAMRALGANDEVPSGSALGYSTLVLQIFSYVVLWPDVGGGSP
jgi:hypothetical protein